LFPVFIWRRVGVTSLAYETVARFAFGPLVETIRPVPGKSSYVPFPVPSVPVA
jgi:hypothetical protein